MEKDTPWTVMMVITLTEMDAAETAMSKSDFHVSEAPPPPEILAVQSFHLQFRFKTEVNQGFSEKS